MADQADAQANLDLTKPPDKTDDPVLRPLDIMKLTKSITLVVRFL